MKMTDWVDKLDAFLAFSEYEVLTNAGKVSAAVARRLAEEQYTPGSACARTGSSRATSTGRFSGSRGRTRDGAQRPATTK